VTKTVTDRLTTPGVTTERVAFASEGERLVGALYRPSGVDPGEPLPAVVVAGTWTSLKEQMAGLYARRLALHGFTAVAFDSRHYGESGGEPREYESPPEKAMDINSAVGFVASQPGVDRQRIGGVGICAGAGYVAANAARDDRVRSLALIAPWLHDATLLREAYGEEGLRARVGAGRSAQARYQTTGDAEYIPAVSAHDGDAAMVGPAFAAYYLDPERGGVPQWPGRLAAMSWVPWLQFDGIAVASWVAQPTLIVHSADAAIPEGVRRFAAALPRPSPIRWMDGIQFDFYDQEPNVTRATEAAAAHLKETL
jgi:fermentation-respiration switch protein FrsA (DUF1100 family)